MSFSKHSDITDLDRSLPWLLVFRAVVAGVLLVATAVAGFTDGPLTPLSPLLYAVGLGTYLVVVILGLWLRAGAPPAVVATAHLVTAALAAALAVQGTGGVLSPLSFLYILAIIDGAIVGARQAALTMASVASLLYGFQLLAQLYGWLPFGGDVRTAESAYAWAAFGHIFAFYLVGVLSGHLAELLRGARAAASTARSDLRHAELLYDDVVAALPVGVITYNQELKVLSANSRASAILGIESSALVDQPLPEALRPFATGGDGFHERMTLIGARTRALWGSRSRIHIDDPNTGPRYVLVVEDRTELRDLERNLNAKQHLASLGELAGAIAHEIRNPLAAVSGAVELLSAEPADVHTRHRLQEIVLREVDRLNRLVGDFLLYARPSEPARAPVSMGALMEDVLVALEREASVSRERVVVDLATASRALIDARQVRQVLLNLLRNAIDASGEGQLVTVRFSGRNADVVIEVQDNGEGIDPQVRPHLFEPFRSTRRSRTGLGLAVVHRIVEGHGGRVEVESEAGRGTVMRVVLPSALESPQTLALAAEP